MNEATPSGIGIDLTQDRLVRAFAWDRSLEVQDASDSGPLPCAILGAWEREPVVVGQDAERHRRAAGFSWPPEARVPSVERGSGRVPLAAAWARLAAPVDWGLVREDPFWWVPRLDLGGEETVVPRRISATAGKILGAAAREALRSSGEARTAIVVPDAIDESAQQALLDECETFLLPRPVALALHWCRTNPRALEIASRSQRTNDKVGWLAVFSTAMDRWEALWLEIRTWHVGTERYLVPLHRRPDEGCELPWVGAAFHHAAAEVARPHAPWRAFVAPSRDRFAPSEQQSVAREQWAALRECLEHGWSSRSRNALGELELWSDLLEAGQGGGSRSKWSAIVSAVLARSRPSDVTEQGLGCVIDGCCADMRIAERETMASLLQKHVSTAAVRIGDGTFAARGAAWAARALATGVPPYLEALVPVELYCKKRDERQDLRDSWRSLIEGAHDSARNLDVVVEAGKEYQSKEPITGLAMRPHAVTVDLTLRRRLSGGKYAYRTAGAPVNDPPEATEAVEIRATIKPGQGYAKVRVQSVTPGLFDGMIDWRTMKECEAPRETFGYMPGVAKITCDPEMWWASRSVIDRVLRVLPHGRELEIVPALRSLLTVANRCPLREKEDRRRGKPVVEDPFQFYGLFPSEGDWSQVPDRKLAERLRSALANFSASGDPGSQAVKLARRLCGWMYHECPRELYLESFQRLRAPGDVDLAILGLCAVKDEEGAAFLSRASRQLAETQVGINNWLRAVRNVVRFREHCLAPRYLARVDLDTLVRAILQILNRQMDAQKTGMIFSNCVNSIPYLLKRRRYEPSYAEEGSDDYRRIERSLLRCLGETRHQQRLSVPDLHRRIAQRALDFLRLRAGRNDLIDESGDSTDEE